MQRLTFDELSALLSAATLSDTEVARLREWIVGIARPAGCLALIEQVAQGRPCPHCHCAHLHRCGCANGLQRFRCCQCGRSHKALTKTPLARLRKREHWLTFPQCVLDSRTVRDSARVTGMHRTTSQRARGHPHPEWQCLAQPPQKLAGAISRCGQPLSGELLGWRRLLSAGRLSTPVHWLHAAIERN